MSRTSAQDPAATAAAAAQRTSPAKARSRGVKAQRARRDPCRVEVLQVSKTFVTNKGDRVDALEDISLSIEPGEIIAIVGPSGCGKSTLLSIVAGLEPHSGGTVTIDDVPVRGPFESMGVAFQKDLLLSWRTILDNVLLPVQVRGLDPRAYRDAAMDLLTLAGIARFAGAYPDELSGGMRQRAAVCRALLQDPSLLLMDEPFGALDMLTRDQIALDFQALWLAVRKTVLLVTHSIDEAIFLADRVVIFTPQPGRIAEILPIDLPRPRHLRDRETAKFGEYQTHIRSLMEQYGILKDQ